MMMKKSVKMLAGIGGLAAVVAVLVMAILNSAGGTLDVIGEGSHAAFDTVLWAMPDKVAANEAIAGWSLFAPDDSARFVWSENGGMLEVDAQPFIEAGLDIGKLSNNYAFDAVGGTLTVGAKFGGDSSANGGASTPLAAYGQIVEKHRSAVHYHFSLDHYGVKLGGGNLFEWAKDMQTNGNNGSDQDKDIVFVLNPEPLVAAGVAPEMVEGWAYALVSVEENGKMMDVWKLLKAFNIQ